MRKYIAILLVGLFLATNAFAQIARRAVPPSYHNGYARNASMSAFPQMWNGLIGVWAMFLSQNGFTLRDESGYGNHGTLTNMTVTDWVIGGNPRLTGYALDFDSVDDSIDMPAAPILDNLPAKTFLFVVSPRSVGENSLGHIISKGVASTTTQGIEVWIETNNSRLKYQIGFSTTELTVTMNTGWTVDVWDHYGIAWNGSQTSSEVLVTRNAKALTHTFDTDGSGTRDDSASIFQIGNRGDTRTWDGQISYVFIYNRALTLARLSHQLIKPPASITSPIHNA